MRVVLRFLRRGHTDHDLVVEVEAAGDATVVFAGDLVEQGAPPAFDDAWPRGLAGDPRTWLHALCPAGPSSPVTVPVVDAAFVGAQRAELAEVAALHAAVAAGRIDAATAARRSPYPDLFWAAANRGGR